VIRRLSIAGLLLLVLLLAMSTWLLYSESALQWAYRQAAVQIPGELAAERISGRLAGPITLENIRFRGDGLEANASRLLLDWNPWSLLGAELRITRLHTEALEVNLPGGERAPGSNTETPPIPRLVLPLSILLQDFEISSLRIIQGDRISEISRIESALALRQGQLEIQSLALETAKLQLRAQGNLEPGADLAHDLEFDWNAHLPSGEAILGQGRLAGNLENTRLRHRLDGAARAELSLDLETPLAQLQWRASLNLVEVDSAKLDPSLPPLLGNLSIDAEGDLETLSASGAAELEKSPYGPQTTRFRVQRLSLSEAATGLIFAGLELDLLQGRITAEGTLDWAPRIQWRTKIAASGLNPAGVLPQWPGRIESRLELNGAIEDAGLAVSIELDRAEGELRGYPLKARGAANWRENRAEVKKIELISGQSRAVVDGTIARELDLQWSLQSADLAELYPGLQGSLEARGRLDGSFEAAFITARLAGKSLAYADYGASAIDAELAVGLDLTGSAGLNLQRVDLRLDAGEVRLQQRLLQRVRLEANEGNLGAEISAAEGTARARLAGNFETDRWQGRLVEAVLLSPDYGDWRLLAPAALSVAPDRIDTETLCLANPQNARLCASLKHQDSSGNLELRLNDLPLDLLKRWIPAEISVASLADADVEMDYSLPDGMLGRVDIDLQPGQVGYELAPGQPQHIDFAAASLKMRLAEAGIETRIDIDLGNGDGVRGAINMAGAKLLELDLDSQRLQGRLDLRLHELGLIDAKIDQVDRLSGNAEIGLDVAGTLSRPQLQGSARLENAALHVPALDLEIRQLNIDAHSTDLRHIEYRLSAAAAEGRIELRGQTELDANTGWPSSISLAAEKLVIAPMLKQQLPDSLIVDGRIDATAELSLRLPDQLLGSIAIGSREGSLSYPLPNGESGRWQYRDINLDLQLEDTIARVNGGFDIGDNRLQVKLRLPGFKPFQFEPKSQPLEGTVAVAFEDLSLLDTLLPDLQYKSGSLQLDLQIAGDLAQPEFRGQAEVAQASLQIARLGITLEKIELSAETDPEGLLAFNASAKSGDGSLGLQGMSRLDRELGWPTEIEITGEDFEAVRIPEAAINLSPRLRVKLERNTIDISGEVHVPYARLQPRDVTTAARVSNDVVIIGEEQERSERWLVSSNVRVILGERVRFFGYGFDGRLGGNLVVEDSPGKPTRGTGEITILEGRYRAYGQHLDVEEGQFLFTGGPLNNPGLDVRAVRITGDVTAGIRVSGRLLKPRLDLFSIPAMGDTNTLSYLLTGGPLDSASGGQGSMMANAALALGLSGGDRIARSIGDRFGFDEMRVESSSSGDQASLVVGRYLSPRLYVGYGVGLIESINTLNLRYKITDRWQLEAESGEQQGADLFYRFER